MEALSSEIEKVKANREVLLDRYLDGKIEDDMYHLKDERLKAKMAEIESKMKQCEQKKSNVADKEERLKMLEEEIKDIADHDSAVKNIKNHIKNQ